MKRTAGVLSVASLVVLAGQAAGQTCVFPPIGPDVIVGVLHDISNSSSDTVAGVSYDSFSLGTTSCNLGNVPVQWYNDGDVTSSQPDIANKHPAIAQSAYRYTFSGGAGRFEQIGQSFLKHGFLALSNTACCSNCSSTDGNTLGVGCSDPYSATRNSGQSNSGPKFQVNAHSGVFPYPVPYSGAPSYTTNTGRRLRIKTTDLVATTGGSAATTRYFGEGQYVCYDDAQAGNNNNNASFREVAVSGSGTAFNFSFASAAGSYNTTQRQKSAIRAWKEIDPRVMQTEIQAPNEGFFILDSRAYLLPSGMWRYEYALYNMNSDRGAGSFTIPVSQNVSVSNIGFHDVDYHSGDGVSATGANWSTYDGTDWPSTKNDMAISWGTAQNFATNQGANAIRWGNTFNFRFDTNVMPSFLNQSAVMGFFKPGMPGDPATFTGAAVTPQVSASVGELFAYLDQWFTYFNLPVNTDPARFTDVNQDNAVNTGDLFYFLDQWFANQ